MRNSWLALVMAGTLLAGCGVTLDPRKREFWVGGTVDAPDDPAIAQKRERTIRATKDTYLACMRDYGADHAKSTATATEIGDAAGAACASDFAAFARASQADFDRIVESAHVSEAGRDRIRRTADDQQAQVIVGVQAQGRQAAVRAVIEARP